MANKIVVRTLHVMLVLVCVSSALCTLHDASERVSAPGSAVVVQDVLSPKVAVADDGRPHLRCVVHEEAPKGGRLHHPSFPWARLTTDSW